MKRIIQGECYDTQTATLIAEARYQGSDDKQNYEEALYRTSQGVFFLAAKGGVDTFYVALFQGGKSAPGTDIIPLTSAEARRWLEDHDHIEIFEKLFGAAPEAGKGFASLDLRLTHETKARLEQMARAEGKSVNEWLLRVIEREVERT